jgi:hypothetical protein
VSVGRLTRTVYMRVGKSGSIAIWLWKFRSRDLREGLYHWSYSELEDRYYGSWPLSVLFEILFLVDVDASSQALKWLIKEIVGMRMR